MIKETYTVHGIEPSLPNQMIVDETNFNNIMQDTL